MHCKDLGTGQRSPFICVFIIFLTFQSQAARDAWIKKIESASKLYHQNADRTTETKAATTTQDQSLTGASSRVRQRRRSSARRASIELELATKQLSGSERALTKCIFDALDTSKVGSVDLTTARLYSWRFLFPIERLDSDQDGKFTETDLFLAVGEVARLLQSSRNARDDLRPMLQIMLRQVRGELSQVQLQSALDTLDPSSDSDDDNNDNDDDHSEQSDTVNLRVDVKSTTETKAGDPCVRDDTTPPGGCWDEIHAPDTRTDKAKDEENPNVNQILREKLNKGVISKAEFAHIQKVMRRASREEVKGPPISGVKSTATTTTAAIGFGPARTTPQSRTRTQTEPPPRHQSQFHLQRRLHSARRAPPPIPKLRETVSTALQQATSSPVLTTESPTVARKRAGSDETPTLRGVRGGSLPTQGYPRNPRWPPATGLAPSGSSRTQPPSLPTRSALEHSSERKAKARLAIATRQVGKLKVTLLGDTSADKVSLMKALVDEHGAEEADEAQSGCMASILGVSIRQRVIHIMGKSVDLSVFSLTGGDQYSHMIQMALTDADVVVLVFSLTDTNSLNNLKQWYIRAHKHRPREATVVICGTHYKDFQKCRDKGERAVICARARKYAKRGKASALIFCDVESQVNIREALPVMLFKSLHVPCPVRKENTSDQDALLDVFPAPPFSRQSEITSAKTRVARETDS